jgi:hypothetical protein
MGQMSDWLLPHYMFQWAQGQSGSERVDWGPVSFDTPGGRGYNLTVKIPRGKYE